MKRALYSAAALVAALAGTAHAQPAGAPPPESAPPVEQAPPPAAAPMPAPAPAPSDAAAGFGAAGQLVFTGDLQVTSAYETHSMSGGHSTTLVFNPSIDYFVAPNFSIGGFLGLATSSFTPSGSSSSSSFTEIGIGPRAGYNIAMGPLVSFWPQIGISYVHTSQDLTGGGSSVSGSIVRLGIQAPFLFHLAPHFFVGIGPAFETELSNKEAGTSQSKTTSFGVTSVVGGYFGG